MFSDSAHSHKWENISYLDSNCDPHDGTLYFRYTDLGAAFIVITNPENQKILEQPEVYFSDPLENPTREVDGNFILDLLYYSEYSFIDDPPRLCFHDPTQEFGISLAFSSKEDGNNMKEFLKIHLTIETPNLPGFYKITRFCPPFYIPAPRQRKGSMTSQQLAPISLDEFRNLVLVFQQVITPENYRNNKSEMRPLYTQEITDFSSHESISRIIHDYTMTQANVFRSFLTLLYLPQPENFDDILMKKYINTKNQWRNFTISQLIRSDIYCDFINKLTQSINKTNFNAIFPKDMVNFLHKITFNILMTICEFDRQFHAWTHPLIDILFILIRSAHITLSKDKICICNNITIELEKLESILFWMLLKFMIRTEVLRLLPMTNKTPLQIVEPLSQFLFKATPYIHEAISCKTCGLLEAAPFLSSCFVGFFTFEETEEIWLAALSSTNSHDFFLCFIIVGIVFSGEELRSDIDEIAESLGIMNLVKQSIDKYSLGFIISSAILLSEKSRSLIGANLK